MIGLVQLSALGVCIVSCLVLAALPLAQRPLRRAIERLPPSAQALALEALVVSPWVVPIAAISLALLPSIAALAWPSLDHCGHHDHHAHLCLAHPPAQAAAAGWLLIATWLAWVFVRAGGALARELRSHAEVLTLRRGARRERDGVFALPTSRVICAVAGLVNPVVLLSDGARARFDAETLEIALAHEAAHVARHDVARQSLARVLASVHFDGDSMLAALAVARERACDERAAVGRDRIEVASALVRAARTMDRALPLAMAAFGPDVLELRVRALLAEPLRAPERRIALTAAGAAAIAVLALTPVIHHALETLLGAITH